MNEQLSVKLPVCFYLLAAGLADTSFAASGNPSAFSVSSNVSIVSDYVYRGFTQTDAGPAIQGGFDVDHRSGLFAGIWNSNVSAAMYNGSTLESDAYFGWSVAVLDTGLDITLKATRYIYPDTKVKSNDTSEYSLDAGYEFDFASINGSFSYSDDYYGTGSAKYLSGSISVPVGISLIALKAGSDTEIADFDLSVSVDYGTFTFLLGYMGTDDKSKNCTRHTCSNRSVFSISSSY